MSDFRAIFHASSILFLLCPAVGFANPAAREAALLTTLTEALLATAVTINDYTDEGLGEFGWSGIYSDREWAVSGEAELEAGFLSLEVTGFLWGDDNENWTVSYSGSGSLGPSL